MTSRFASLLTILSLSSTTALAAHGGGAFGGFLPVTTQTGRVVATPVICVTWPCPPLVELVSGDRRAVITGPLASEIAAFSGRIVTVRGNRYDASTGWANEVEALDFVPGRATEFVTGEVRSDFDCSGDRTGECKPIAWLDLSDGERVQIPNAEVAKTLMAVNGAKVKMKGRFGTGTCGAGISCRTFQPTSRRISVEGILDAPLSTLPGLPPSTYVLLFPNGTSIDVDTRSNLVDRLRGRLWLTGRIDDADGPARFRAVSASRAVFDYVGAVMSEGANPGRHDATRGGAPIPTTAPATGAGQRR